MRLTLGVNTCFAVKRWPRPEDWAPLVRERLGLGLVQHSLDLVEIGWSDAPSDALIAAQARRVREAAAAHRLTVHSTFTGLAAYSSNLLLHPDEAARQRAAEWFRRVIAFTAQVGAAGTGGHVGAFGVADWQDPLSRQALGADLQERLAELAADARQAGLEFLLVENLAAVREPSTMEQVRRLLTDGDEFRVPIRLCLDVGHQCVPGTSEADRDPYVWLRELGRSAPVIQLQQSDATADHHWPFTPDRNRAGRIEADRVLDALAESGVEDAALILEVIPAFEQADDEVLRDLEVSVGYWREALDRRGFGAALAR